MAAEVNGPTHGVMVECNELAAGTDVVAIGLEVRPDVEIIDPKLHGIMETNLEKVTSIIWKSPS